MNPATIWGERWLCCEHSISRRYMQIACEKRSLVVLAADKKTMHELNQLLEDVGDYISALKTHVDLIDDWSKEGWENFISNAKSKNLLIFEDRKHGDIGKIARDQMGGIYDSRTWADLITAHLISGPSILDGMQEAWESVNMQGGVLLLAQMSSEGNLLGLPGYTDSVVNIGKSHPVCFGFIGNGSRPNELKELRKKVGEGKMIWTPGVNLNTQDAILGQRYGDPEVAILSGSDAIIIGSGIHNAKSPKDAAKKYAEISWNALLKRCE
jgi:orotidine 5'-phosphate decarboxylase subfamily 1